MDRIRSFRIAGYVLKIVLAIVAVNLVLIATALVTGIARMSFHVTQEAIRGNFALTELLLVGLVSTIVTILTRIYFQYREESSASDSDIHSSLTNQ